MPQTGQVALRQVSQERCQLAVPTLQQGLGSRHWRAAVPWTLVEQKAAGSNQLSLAYTTESILRCKFRSCISLQ